MGAPTLHILLFSGGGGALSPLKLTDRSSPLGDPGKPLSPNPEVRSPPLRFASPEKCVPSRLPYARRGGDRTIVPPAGGGDAHVRLSALQPAAGAPEIPTFRPPGPGLHCPGSPRGREERPHPELGGGRTPLLPLDSPGPHGAASAPAAAELPQPLTARPEHLAARSPRSRGGAGRARAERGGASGRREVGRGRPSGAELGGAGRGRQSRPAACVPAPFELRRWAPRTPTSAQAPAKLLFSWAPRGVRRNRSTRPALCSPAAPAREGTCIPRPPGSRAPRLLTC